MARDPDIRTYQEDDHNAVVALWRAIFPETPAHNDPTEDIARKLDVQRDLFFVAEDDSQLVGTAMAGFDGHRGWVYYVAVDPGVRRQGIGASLMRRVEQALADRGCSKLNLQIRAGNEDVIAFYRALGYEVEDRVSMSRRLEGA